MSLPIIDNESGGPRAENNFDELIYKLITQRKLQQEALFKIKASVEKKQSDTNTTSDHSAKKQTEPKP
jgi:hypothetical protein